MSCDPVLAQVLPLIFFSLAFVFSPNLVHIEYLRCQQVFLSVFFYGLLSMDTCRVEYYSHVRR